MSGGSDSPGRTLSLQVRTPGFAGRITPSKRTIAAGTARTPITIITGTIPFMTASAIRVGTIRLSLATTAVTALTPLAPWSATTARVTRSAWRPAQSSLVAVTWTRAYGTPARYIECMQWFLAPTRIGGGDPDPTKAPDITNNSWHCPPEEGCSFDTLQAAVEAQAAAGIMMASAAQNAGPGCSTVENPPGIYEATYSVGALNTGTDTIAGFSSRGPVTADGSNRIKPDISAPGTNTRSSTNDSDSSYAAFSGTSMATPHIAGAMALLWYAIPSLRHQLTASRDALNNSAVHIISTQCGDAGPPNNVYGWGRVDILAAVGGAPSPTPTATATATTTPPPSPSPTPTDFPPPTATPTTTPRPTPTPRGTPPSRLRPTPHPRP